MIDNDDDAVALNHFGHRILKPPGIGQECIVARDGLDHSADRLTSAAILIIRDHA